MTAADSRHTLVQCQSQQPNRWQKEEVSRQIMAPAVNTWTGQRGVGHCASESAATSRAYFPSRPRRPSAPYAATLQWCRLALIKQLSPTPGTHGWATARPRAPPPAAHTSPPDPAAHPTRTLQP